MPRYIIIKLQGHTTDDEAQEFVDDINRTFQPHYDAYVTEADEDPQSV